MASKLKQSWSAVEQILWRIALNGRYLYNGSKDFNSVPGRLFGTSLAMQRSRVCPFVVNTNRVMGLAISWTQ